VHDVLTSVNMQQHSERFREQRPVFIAPHAFAAYAKHTRQAGLCELRACMLHSKSVACREWCEAGDLSKGHSPDAACCSPHCWQCAYLPAGCCLLTPQQLPGDCQHATHCHKSAEHPGDWNKHIKHCKFRENRS